MPNWSEIFHEIAEEAKRNPNAIDDIRRRYISQLAAYTNRNVIAYYSGWLQKPNNADVAINDKDKNALMLTVNKLDKTKGLDLILHTPGGDLASTESIVDYLHSMFGKDIRAIIPQISMSAGTMVALSCKSIIMGKQSNLGPIDPQMNGFPCQGIIAEFDRAKEDIRSNPASAPLWQVIISKYHPTLLSTCEHAIKWSEELAEQWLMRNMCEGDVKKSKKILKEFSDHKTNKSHARHISKQKCFEIGLTIESLESDQTLQDKVLSVHHSFMLTFGQTNAIKIVENQLGAAFIEAKQQAVNMPMGMLSAPMGVQ